MASHLTFALYIFALLSGVMLLSGLSNNPRYKDTSTFPQFVAVYVAITIFISLTTMFLYFMVNVSEADWMMKFYTASTMIFICTLSWLFSNHSAAVYTLDYSPVFKLFIYFIFGFGIVSAISFLWLSWEISFWLLIFAIFLMLVVLVTLEFKTRKLYHRVFSGLTAKNVSLLMIIQSLFLTLIEIWFFKERLSTGGFTFSLPILYIINNALTWWFKNELLPDNRKQDHLYIAENILSPREKEIVNALTSGLSNKQIASELNISPSTVKNHLYHIFKKYGVTNRVALLAKINPIET